MFRSGDAPTCLDTALCFGLAGVSEAVAQDFLKLGDNRAKTSLRAEDR